MSDMFLVDAVTPLRGRAPGFGTVLFKTRRSNGMFIQETNDNTLISAFHKVEVPEKVPLALFSQYNKKAVGDEALFGFLTANEEVLVGTRDELRWPLTNQFSRLKAYPFVQHQVAKFLGKPDAIYEAQARVAFILAGDRSTTRRKDVRDLPDADAIPVVELEAQAFRLTAQAPATSMLATAPLSEAVSRSALSAAGFWRPSPFPSYFSTGGDTAFYAAFAFEDAIAEVASSLRRKMLQQGWRDAVQQYLVTEFLCRGVFHDLTSMKSAGVEMDEDVGVRHTFQELGRELRKRGSLGVIYRSPGRLAGRLLCLFSTAPLVVTRPIRRLAVRIIGGELSWQLL